MDYDYKRLELNRALEVTQCPCGQDYGANCRPLVLSCGHDCCEDCVSRKRYQNCRRTYTPESVLLNHQALELIQEIEKLMRKHDSKFGRKMREERKVVQSRHSHTRQPKRPSYLNDPTALLCVVMAVPKQLVRDIIGPRGKTIARLRNAGLTAEVDDGKPFKYVNGALFEVMGPARKVIEGLCFLCEKLHGSEMRARPWEEFFYDGIEATERDFEDGRPPWWQFEVVSHAEMSQKKSEVGEEHIEQSNDFLHVRLAIPTELVRHVVGRQGWLIKKLRNIGLSTEMYDKEMYRYEDCRLLEVSGRRYTVLRGLCILCKEVIGTERGPWEQFFFKGLKSELTEKERPPWWEFDVVSGVHIIQTEPSEIRDPPHSVRSASSNHSKSERNSEDQKSEPGIESTRPSMSHSAQKGITTKKVLYIPNEYVGLTLGRKGSYLDECREQTGATLDLDATQLTKNGHSVCALIIMGTDSQVAEVCIKLVTYIEKRNGQQEPLWVNYFKEGVVPELLTEEVPWWMVN